MKDLHALRSTWTRVFLVMPVKNLCAIDGTIFSKSDEIFAGEIL